MEGVRTMARPDFPRTLAEFRSRFVTEEDCRRYLVECRWPDGYRCPRCAHAEAYELSNRALFQCRSCRHQVVSPTTRHQRCTVHKTTNVLDKPKSVQPAAKADLREIWTAPASPKFQHS